VKQLNAIHFGSVLIILFFAIVAVFTPFSFYGCGGGGAGGGAAGAGAGGNPIDGGPVDYSLHIIGRVVNQGGALPNISAAIFPAVPLSGWEVYLESYPSIETVTDANGKFTLTPVPAGNHRVVVKLLSGTQLFKSRSRIISVGGAANEADAGDLPAALATSRVRGILKDIQGNPVTGTPLSLWGEVFFTDTQGSYESPLMPDNSGGVISVKDPRFKSIDLEFVFSSPNPPYLETMMVPPGQTNGAPDVRVLANAYSVNAGFPLSLTASATDPEGDQLSYFWSASTGSISTGTNPAQANWTAPVEGSIATVALEVRDPAGLSAKYFVGLTILGSRPDTTPPTILAVLPASGSTGVLTSAAISIAFSEPMDPTTLNSTSITLASGAVPISGNITVSTDGKAATFTPTAALPYESTIDAAIATAAKDIVGNALAANMLWAFTTIAAPDTAAPTIVSVTPADNATNVASGSSIEANFSEAMASGTITATTFTVASGGTAIAGGVSLSLDGKTATFIPIAALPYESSIAATIATGAKDLAGNALAANKLWAFTTTPVPDTTAPTIVSVTPGDAATNIATGSQIEATFSEAMASGTITATTFKVASGGAAIAGSVSLSADGKTATFTPTAALPYESLITATITTGAKDIAGNAVAANKVWAFTTTVAPDTTPPTIVSVAPADAATNIATGSPIAAQFSEMMASGTITATTFKVASGGTTIAGSVSLSTDGKIATFTPTTALPYGSSVTATITTGVTDLAGNALAANKVWAFTTVAPPDTTPPTIVSVAPADAATGVATGSPIAARFSEAMDSGTFTGTTFTLASGGTAIDGSVSLSSDGKTATFTPTAALPYGSSVTATITTGVTDLAGNALAANKVWAFTTIAPPDTTPPAIVSVTPADAATNVAVASSIEVHFSEAMDTGTITETTFAVASGITAIGGSISFSTDGMTATFTPSVALPYASAITATITTGAKDLAGNPLATNRVWAFTTAADLTPPTIVALSPANNATNVATASTISARFSEAMNAGTITATTFSVASGGTAIVGSISFYNNTTPIFTPTAALPYGSTITATITTDVKDLAGNALAANMVWTFSTTASPPAPLLITEVSSSEFSNSFRWVEVYNTTGASIDLGNYKFRSLTIPRSSGPITGPVLFSIPALSVPANSYAAIRVKGSDTDVFDGTNLVHILGAGDAVPYWGADGFVELVDASNQTVDFVRWGTDVTTPLTSSEWVSGAAPALPSTDGSAIARPLALDDTDSGADWTLRSFPTPGGPNDVTSNTDADGDGIPDVCEQSGATYMGMPVYDWGARASQKDVFLHIDYMNSSDLGVNPRKDSLDNVVQVFANHGYTLHLNVGTLFGSGAANHNLDNLSHQIAFSQYLTLGSSGSAANLYEIKASRLPLPERHVFYYCIFGSEQPAPNTGSSGLGELDGNDFMVSLGNWSFFTSTPEDTNKLVNYMASTFMHEFGHNLGLYHGGTDSVNYKPNYLSIMNYLYQLNGVSQIGNVREGDRYYYKQWAESSFSTSSPFYQYFSASGSQQMHDSPWTTSFRMDYSNGSGTTLAESSLTESEGLKRTLSTGVDWNGNGNTTDTALSMDVNFTSGTVESYGDFNDWGNLNFIFQQKPQGIANGLGGKVKRPYSFNNSDAQKVADEPPMNPLPSLSR